MPLSAFRATLPNATTKSGSTRSIVRRKNPEQLLISIANGLSLFPCSSRGLQRTALVMNTQERPHFMAFNSSSKRIPVRSWDKGIPVTCAPSRPGASATNSAFAPQSPLRLLRTRRDSAILGHSEHFCASETKVFLAGFSVLGLLSVSMSAGWACPRSKRADWRLRDINNSYWRGGSDLNQAACIVLARARPPVANDFLCQAARLTARELIARPTLLNGRSGKFFSHVIEK